MYKIFESNDYEKLTYFFYDNGLEIIPGIKRPDNVVNCWECMDSISHKLIGGAVLEIREGAFVVADVAVDNDYRKENIGTQLMNTIEEEIIKAGGSEAWLVAKIPEFYIKLGWEVVVREQAPDISKCFSCLKYGKECNPQIMYKAFK
ncbi:MAG: GNAT family N-acetyltransferase [Bacillota bacterium]